SERSRTRAFAQARAHLAVVLRRRSSTPVALRQLALATHRRGCGGLLCGADAVVEVGIAVVAIVLDMDCRFDSRAVGLWGQRPALQGRERCLLLCSRSMLPAAVGYRLAAG